MPVDRPCRHSPNAPDSFRPLRPPTTATGVPDIASLTLAMNDRAETPSVSPPPSTRLLRQALPWMLVGVGVFGCAWLGQLYLSKQAELAVTRDQQALADLEVIGTRHQLEAERLLASRERADAQRHVSQLDAQVEQATRQLADARRAYVDLSLRYVRDHAELKRLRDGFADVSRQADQIRQSLAASATAKLADLTMVSLVPRGETTSDARAIVVWSPVAQEAICQTFNLPAPANGQVFHLWLVGTAAGPIDLGDIGRDTARAQAPSTFKLPPSIGATAGFAISLEPAATTIATPGDFLLRSP